MAFWSKKSKGDSADQAPPPATVQPAAAAATAPAAAPAANSAAKPAAVAQAPAAPRAVASVADAPAPAPKPATATPAAVTAPGQLLIGANLTVVLGRAMAVLLSSPRHQAMTLGDVYARFLPALALNQFAIADARQTNANGETQQAPIAVVLWAKVSEAVENRILADLSKPVALSAAEWNSGDRLWVIEAIGPPAAIGPMFKQMIEGPFGGSAFKLRRKAANGSGFQVETIGLEQLQQKAS